MSFGKRHRDHLIHILGLNYGIFDPDKAEKGICELVWKGSWRDKTVDAPLKQIEAYGAIHKDVIRYLSVIQIFFAELKVENRLRKHIEGCIGWNLRNKHPDYKALYPDDNHVGTIQEEYNGMLHVSASEVIRGLDSRIQY